MEVRSRGGMLCMRRGRGRVEWHARYGEWRGMHCEGRSATCMWRGLETSVVLCLPSALKQDLSRRTLWPAEARYRPSFLTYTAGRRCLLSPFLHNAPSTDPSGPVSLPSVAFASLDWRTVVGPQPASWFVLVVPKTFSSFLRPEFSSKQAFLNP